jgi:hypothetical protein
MSTARFDELVATYKRHCDVPTYRFIFSMYIIASNLARETYPDTTLIDSLYRDMVIPAPSIYNRSMEIYAATILKIGIWKITKNNGIEEDRYILDSIQDLKYRLQRYEILRDTYESRKDHEKREYDCLLQDFIKLVGPTIRELLHDQGGNIRLNQ